MLDTLLQQTGTTGPHSTGFVIVMCLGTFVLGAAVAVALLYRGIVRNLVRALTAGADDLVYRPQPPRPARRPIFGGWN